MVKLRLWVELSFLTTPSMCFPQFPTTSGTVGDACSWTGREKFGCFIEQLDGMDLIQCI